MSHSDTEHRADWIVAPPDEHLPTVPANAAATEAADSPDELLIFETDGDEKNDERWIQSDMSILLGDAE